MTWLKRNFWWKLGSLVLAVLLWFAFEGEPELVTVQQAQIFYRNLAPDLVVAATVPTQVRLELRGPSGSLSRDDLIRITVQLDLNGVTEPGARTVPISTANVRLPEGVTLVRSEPPELPLKLEKATSSQ